MLNTTPTTLDFLAVWTDIYGSTYQQTIKLTPDNAWPNQLGDELAAHLAWVCEHHAIASYSITSL
jgi:hypothetical protein